MRRFTVLRAYVHVRDIVRRACRRCAVGLSVVAGSAYWAVTTVATSGAAFVLGSAVLCVTAIAGAFCWLVGWRM